MGSFKQGYFESSYIYGWGHQIDTSNLRSMICGFLLTAWVEYPCVFNQVYQFLCSLRVLLQKSCKAESSVGGQQSPSLSDDLKAAGSLVQKVFTDSLTQLQESPGISERSIRWELGSCWVQHLKKQETSTSNNSKDILEDDKLEPAVKGLGKQFELLKKIKRKKDTRSEESEVEKDPSSINSREIKEMAVSVELKNGECDSEGSLEKLLPKAAFMHLKESGTGLHEKVFSLSFKNTML